MIETNGVMPLSVKHFKAYDKATRNHWNGQQKFRLSKSPNPVYNPHLILPITKYSPLFDIFNPMVLQLIAGGIIEQLCKFYYLNYIEEKEEGKLQQISVGHLLTGTYGCILGLFLAVLAFLVEHFSIRKARKTKAKSVKIAK